MSKHKKIRLVRDALLMSVLVLADQFTKYLADVHLKDQGSVVLIDGVLQLTFLGNQGAILGILRSQKAFILFIVIVLLFVIAYVLLKLPDRRRFTAIHVALSCLTAGALGNMIDRIRFGYVVDFIYFIKIDFPIFNVADIFISVSTIVLLLLFLFYYKEKDLDFLNFVQKKYRELK